jgi:hypothetical protein
MLVVSRMRRVVRVGSRRSKYRSARRTTEKTHYNYNSKQIFVVVYVNMCADAKKNFCSYEK